MVSDSLRACACGSHYDAQRWAALPLFARLTPEHLSSLVTVWAPDVAVEVRVCKRCRRPISRLKHAVQDSVTQEQAIGA